MEGSGMDFEELDNRSTPLGELSLRRRTQIALGVELYEVKLGDEFLMSSLFTEGEIALAQLAPAGLGAGPLDVDERGLIYLVGRCSGFDVLEFNRR
jgi:hypothetical protein